MSQSKRHSLNQASSRKPMVCHRRITVDGGVVRCLSDVLRPVCVAWMWWFPSSVEVICERYLFLGKSLTSVTFESNSRLSRVGKEVFYWSGLQSIHHPGSLEVTCKLCFSDCHSLTSVALDPSLRIRVRISDLQAGIPFDCRSSDAIRDTRTGRRCCSVN
jgi:hypothetical protein